MMIPFAPPSSPWSTNADRNLNKYERADKIVEWKGAAKLAYGGWCGSRGVFRRLNPALIRVHIPFTVNRRRDPHNYCGTVVKAVIDGLVMAGAWKDDTPEYVVHIEPRLYKGDTVWIELHAKRTMRIACEHGRYEDECEPLEITW